MRPRPTRWTRTFRTAAAMVGGAALVAAAACSSDQTPGSSPVAPVLPATPVIPPQYRTAAFVFDVSTLKREVKIRGAEGTVNSPASLSLSRPDGPQRYSLLGGDVIELTASDYSASASGQFTPGKVRIRFKLNITNKLSGVELITPTFPTPPTGETGVFLFPFEYAVTATAGGVAVGGEGNEVIVTTPRGGAVAASSDWNGTGSQGSGEPFNFFNDVGCGPTANDCFRYETFNPIASGGTSEAREVGFDIDPTVGDFRVRIIVAANLRNAQDLRGSVAGTVTSPQRGALAGATVTVSGSPARIATTNASGAYTLDSVSVGPRSVSVSNLPAGCTAPAAQTVTVTGGASATANFSVACSVPAGAITGTLTSSLGGGLSGVSIVATPTGGSAQAAVTSGASGAFSIANVPVGAAGTGSLALTNLPAGCTNPGPINYSGLVSGGSIVVDRAVTCAAAPVTYPLTATWGAITNTGPTGRQVTLTYAIDMGAAPGRPDVNGANADSLAGIQLSVAYDASKLTYASRSILQPDEFDLVVVNGNNPGLVNLAVASSSAATKGGQFAFVRLTFNIPAGVSGSVATATSVVDAVGAGNVPIVSNVAPTEATLTIP